MSNSHYAKGDPELDALITTVMQFRPVSQEIGDLRKFMDSAVASRVVSFDGVELGEVRIPVNGAEILAYTYWPANAAEGSTFPLIVNFHGGGYSVGHARMDHQLCCLLCVRHGVSVLNVDYRLAPEHPFPIPIDDSYLAVLWAAEHPALLKADLSKGFIVCGTSAGGNFAASIALQARDDPNFKAKLTGQILIVPEVYSKTFHPIEKYKDVILSLDEDLDPTLPRVRVISISELYEAGASKAEIGGAKRSPLLAETLSNLPRAVVMISGRDSIRDEGILYAKLLREANGGDDHVQMNIYPSAWHGFHMSAPTAAATKKFYNDLHAGVEWLLRN